VEKPPEQRRVPEHLRGMYGVCPSCRARAPLPKRPKTLACTRCRQEFPVNYGE
jgi:hypothetical protein